MYDTALTIPSSSPTNDEPTSATSADNPDNASAICTDEVKTVNSARSTAVQVRFTGRMLNFTRLHIQGNDIERILATVSAKLGQKRQSNLPVVVSYTEPLALKTLWDGLWALGLQPIGLVTGELDEEAEKLQIAIFPVDGQRIDGKTKPAVAKVETVGTKQDKQDNKDTSVTSVTTAQDSDATSAGPNQSHHALDDKLQDKLTIDTQHTSPLNSHMEGDLVHNHILRSGQSINHVGGDLILTKGINAGAEAITDYSLHVYGKAEGRLVAGATGDKNAKIFCLKFNPSLVSVAGTYCLKENIPAELINQAVQVSYIDGEGLVFEQLDI